MKEKNDRYFLQKAIDLAEMGMSQKIGGPFGCVIVKNGEIIAEGVNNVTSSNDPTAHAEITAIRLACNKLKSFQLEGCTLYTSCEPCPMCFGAIYWARPDRMVYAASAEDAAYGGFDDAFIYEELKVPEGKRRIRTSQDLHVEGRKVFDLWIGLEGKIDY